MILPLSSHDHVVFFFFSENCGLEYHYCKSAYLKYLSGKKLMETFCVLQRSL